MLLSRPHFSGVLGYSVPRLYCQNDITAADFDIFRTNFSYFSFAGWDIPADDTSLWVQHTQMNNQFAQFRLLCEKNAQNLSKTKRGPFDEKKSLFWKRSQIWIRIFSKFSNYSHPNLTTNLKKYIFGPIWFLSFFEWSVLRKI